ncbi:MAG TPA: hypothetical protein PLJ29_16555 [Leptospiraceae bacterium]|nr:hypothetical protein [Leptospiraceae bacterium]
MMFQEQIPAVKLLPLSESTFRNRENEPDLISNQIHLKKGRNHSLPFFSLFTMTFMRRMLYFRPMTFREA